VIASVVPVLAGLHSVQYLSATDDVDVSFLSCHLGLAVIYGNGCRIFRMRYSLWSAPSAPALRQMVRCFAQTVFPHAKRGVRVGLRLCSYVVAWSESWKSVVLRISFLQFSFDTGCFGGIWVSLYASHGLTGTRTRHPSFTDTESVVLLDRLCVAYADWLSAMCSDRV